MWKPGTSASVLRAAMLLLIGACAGPGLPPAGPAPGETQVGYGTQEKEKVTGAVTTVPGSNASARSANVEELLRGRAAGLQIIKRPEGGYRFQIRGISGVESEPPEPLFIVDGTPVTARNVDTALAGLTRDDIKQVDVLKDIASTSIYGTRGVGGVIIIATTRR
jgi:TonB-dependent SusC/RagA subfamily outer membrane receptor